MAKKIASKAPTGAGKKKPNPKKKVTPRKEENDKKKDTVRDVIRKVEGRLLSAAQNLGEAIDDLAGAELDGARDATMRAMNIIGDAGLLNQLDDSAAEIQDTMDAIEELESELL